MAIQFGSIAALCFILFFLFSNDALASGADSTDMSGKGAFLLTDEMFDNFLQQNGEAMIFFYAPWCYWSRLVMPEFDAAAKVMALHHSPVKMAKVDCTMQKQITLKEQIREFPTLKLFINGKAQNYYGGRRRTDIINWIDAFLGRDKALTSVNQLDELIQNIYENHLVVIAAFPPSFNNTSFALSSRRMGDSIFFGETSLPSVINHLKHEYFSNYFPMDFVSALSLPFIVILRNFENERHPVFFKGNFDDPDQIALFVKLNNFPSVIKFDNEWAPKLFEDGRALFFVILDTADDTEDRANSTDSIIALLSEEAPQYKSKFLFAITGNKEFFEKRLISQLALEDESYPIMRILTLKSTKDVRNNPNKYKPLTGSKVDKESMIQFLEDFSNDRLKPYVKTEFPPENDANEDVKTLVGETFEAEVRQSPKDSFVMFHAPWCGYCRELLPAFTELAVRLKEVPNLVIAKLDATRNEVQNLPLGGYPSLVLFPAKHKHNPLFFDGDRTVADMMHWLAENVDLASFSPMEHLTKPITKILNDDETEAEEL